MTGVNGVFLDIMTAIYTAQITQVGQYKLQILVYASQIQLTQQYLYDVQQAQNAFTAGTAPFFSAGNVSVNVDATIIAQMGSLGLLQNAGNLNIIVPGNYVIISFSQYQTILNNIASAVNGANNLSGSNNVLLQQAYNNSLTIITGLSKAIASVGSSDMSVIQNI